MQKHDCKSELRNVDLKVTKARLGILAALEHTNIPLDVTSLIHFLQKKDILVDRVTVFRNINALTQKGLAKPIQLNEGKLRYEHIARSDHHHFICENCGKIEDITDCNVDDIEKNISKKKGLLINHHSLEFFGICKRCQ